MPTYFIPGTPAPQGSKRAYIRNGRAILVESSTKLQPWRNHIRRTTATHIPTPLDGPMSITATFVMPRPKHWGRNRNDPMTQRPDSDKLARALLDGLTGVAYRDDSQVTHLNVTKRRAHHGEPTGVHLTIEHTEETT